MPAQSISFLEMINTQMRGTIPHLYAHTPCISMSASILGKCQFGDGYDKGKRSKEHSDLESSSPNGYEYIDGRYGDRNGYSSINY
jgi:hypothetical protein